MSLFPGFVHDAGLLICPRVDKDLNCIKGGGACHLREKVLAEAAMTFVVVADYRKNSTILGTNVRPSPQPYALLPALVDVVLIVAVRFASTNKEYQSKWLRSPTRSSSRTCTLLGRHRLICVWRKPRLDQLLATTATSSSMLRSRRSTTGTRTE